MAMNDRDNTLVGARGVDIYPGVANPTESSRNDDPMGNNFVGYSPITPFLNPYPDTEHRSPTPPPGRAVLARR